MKRLLIAFVCTIGLSACHSVVPTDQQTEVVDATFTCPTYVVTVSHGCKEGCASCDKIGLVFTNRKTTETIRLTGSTWHHTGSNGPATGAFWGYRAKHNSKEYVVLQRGEMYVTKDTKTLLSEKGKWVY